MKDRSVFKKRAEKLVAQMTLEEKASQLLHESPAIERLGIPAYNWWNEALHGVARAGTATSFPQAIGLAATFDETLLGKIAEAIGKEGRARYNALSRHGDRGIFKGLTFWAPNVNIFRDPRWGRGHETYGEDPFLSGRLGAAFIQGLQGAGAYMLAAACAKHFAVHSGPEALRHSFDAKVSEKDLWETYLPAFEACVREADVEAVMGAYNRTNGEPCCGSYLLLRDILREKWGFEGHVVSDCWAIKDIFMHHSVRETPEEAAALAIDAGCDLNCGCTFKFVTEAVKKGLLTEAQVTQAVVRLFTTRFLLGMFDETEYDAIPWETVECPAHIGLAAEAAEKSLVLLKNDGILPLKKTELKTVGVIGPNANSRLALIGNYYGTSSRYITLLEGIQDEAGEEVRVLYAQGCELLADRTEKLALEGDRLAEAVTVAEHSDVVILCLGLDETMEGEEPDEGNFAGSGDKDGLLLPGVQRELLEKVTEAGKPVILCLTAGSALDLRYAEERCSAVLQAWYPGARGGKAVADVLFGHVSPSGKLPVTFYQDTEHLPPFEDYSMKGRTYRYLESEPLYPFGYGLTYGDTACVSVACAAEGTEADTVIAELVVRNRGAVSVEDVAQVYLEPIGSRYAPPHPSLCAFCRVSLAPGETKTVKMAIPQRAFQTVNDHGERIQDAAEFILHAGFSGPDSRSAALTGNSTASCKLRLTGRSAAI